MTITVNPLKGEAAVAIGDDTLHLVLDNAALLALEDHAGRSFLDVVAELYADMTAGRLMRVGTMQTLLWAATRAKHAKLTPAACGTLILRHRELVMTGVVSALAGALPGKDAASGEAKPPRKRRPRLNGTGTTSSAAG